MGKSLRDYTLPGFPGRQTAAVELAMDGEGDHFIATSPDHNAYIFSRSRSMPSMSIPCSSAPLQSVDWYALLSAIERFGLGSRARARRKGRGKAQLDAVRCDMHGAWSDSPTLGMGVPGVSRCGHRNMVALACGNSVRVMNLKAVKFGRSRMRKPVT